MITEQVKVCTKCKTEKPITEFGTNQCSKDGIETRCKLCKNKRASKHNKEHPVTYAKNSRAAHLRKSYNMTLEEYDRLYLKQNGMCAICGTSKCPSGHTLAVDHNHNTGQVRMLLCVDCNSLLGRAKDNIEILKKAILYLEAHNYN